MAHPREKKTPWIIAGIVIGLVYAVVLISWYRSGDLGLVMDARLVEVNICLTESEYIPVKEVSKETESIYLCGKVEGTTKLSAAIYVFYKGKVIQDDSVRVNPGTFFIPIKTTGMLHSGKYRIEVRRERQVLGKVEFIVVE